MDQVKVGKFIKAMRKQNNLTQRELSEKLNVSDKTISKWETGNGLPEVSLMLPLCEILQISVNELLSGEKLDEKKYYIKAEENIMSLIKEKQESKKKIIISAVVVFIVMLSSITIIILAGLLEMDVWLRVMLLCIALMNVILGVAIACVLDRDAGVYECKSCGEKFIPTMKTYVMGMHGITWRRLKCPKCGKTSNCKKRLNR